MKEAMTIGNHPVGPGHPVFVVAEMSANHGGDFDRAVALIRAMKESGADAVKLQTYTADTLTLKSGKEHFRIGRGTVWEGRTLYDLYEEAHTPWDWHKRLMEAAAEEGLEFFSTPFDDISVDFLEELNVPAYKIASFEIVDIPLIMRVAATGKPLILSTGMATRGEIREAVSAGAGEGCDCMALLKCASAYPASCEDMNLRTIPDMAREFGTIVGLSDHTLGTAVPVAAVALGACIVEKHFTLSRNVRGPDSAFSLEPSEFRQMVDAVRMVEKALGDVSYEPTEHEKASRLFRRSLFVVQDVKAGEPFTEQNVRSIRPGYGLPPKYLDIVLKKRAARNITRGMPLSWDVLL